MNTSGIEIETKFLVRDLKMIETRLQDLGAQLITQRQYEQNLRFDLPDESLRKSHRVLRLRQDQSSKLTYKGPGKKPEGGIRAREEWEVTVDDFEVMRRILESLGYGILFTYEKYRTTYELKGTEIMLDELPFGLFVEIEGKTQKDILDMAAILHLRQECAIPDSYQVEFDNLKSSLNLTFRDLTFNNFQGITVQAASLSATYADQ